MSAVCQHSRPVQQKLIFDQDLYLLFSSLVGNCASFFPMLMSALVSSNSGARRGALQMHCFLDESVGLQPFARPFELNFNVNLVSSLKPLGAQFDAINRSKHTQLLSNALPLIKSPMDDFRLPRLRLRFCMRLLVMAVVSLRVRECVCVRVAIALAWIGT
jgi:hypothetical protein